jgi:hypothetical protein
MRMLTVIGAAILAVGGTWGVTLGDPPTGRNFLAQSYQRSSDNGKGGIVLQERNFNVRRTTTVSVDRLLSGPTAVSSSGNGISMCG